MSKWEKIIEGDQLYWINEEVGSVIPVGENAFVACAAKIIKLGPFETVEQAQAALENNQEAIDQLLENFNFDLLKLTKAAKEQ